jgi:hypothetical protein
MIEHKNLGCTEYRETQSGKPRVAFAAHACYFDTYNEASVATRSLMECLATWGFPAMAMTSTVVDAGKELDPGNWLAEQGLMPVLFDGQADPASGIVPNVNASPSDTKFINCRLCPEWHGNSIRGVPHRTGFSSPRGIHRDSPL